MSPTRLWAAAAAVAVLSAACAGRASVPQAAAEPAQPTYTLRQVDTGPREVHCHTDPRSTSNVTALRTVHVRFTVDETGAVVNPIPQRERRPIGLLPNIVDGSVLADAARIMAECRFEPATLDGEPVAVRGLTRSVSVLR